MKGSEKLLTVLNQLLAGELTAISQYKVHSETCDNWGYGRLYKEIEGRARDEMRHAEWLVQRILSLEGTPVVSKLNPIKIGLSVRDMVTNDQEAELGAVRSYNNAIALAHEVSDRASADLLLRILEMEEGHVGWADIQRAQIEQMGLENYLTHQTD